jgi:two-component system, NarL family, response regulator NreC
MRRIRVVLADDHRVVREGLRLLLSAQSDMEVVGEADNGEAAMLIAQRERPDVVVMDISMSGINGLTATERLTELCPGTAVLTLTRHGEEGYIHALLRAGAKGYVLKQSTSDELLSAIRALAAGRTYFDRAVSDHLVGNLIDRRRRVPSAKELSAREEAVLRLASRGLLNREIAARLDISIKTAEAHKANAMNKLGMTSRVDIIDYALLRGWLKEE